MELFKRIFGTSAIKVAERIMLITALAAFVGFLIGGNLPLLFVENATGNVDNSSAAIVSSVILFVVFTLLVCVFFETIHEFIVEGTSGFVKTHRVFVAVIMFSILGLLIFFGYWAFQVLVDQIFFVDPS